MSEKKKKVKVLNTSANRVRRIKTEVNRCTKMMERLLQRRRDGKPGGIIEGGGRHTNLQKHIAGLQGKVR